MFRKVLISEVIPRVGSEKNFAYVEGLGLQRWLGFFFLFGAILLLLISLFVLKRYAISVVFIAITALAYTQVRSVAAKIKVRELVYENGRLVKARVVGHSKVFKFYKSKRNYAIAVEIDGGTQCTIESPSEDLWRTAPVGSTIIGLVHQGSYLFGEEVRCQFVVE